MANRARNPLHMNTTLRSTALNRNQLSSRELCLLFSASYHTITRWGHGSTRVRPLPKHYKIVNGHKVLYYTVSEVKRWAEEEGRSLSCGISKAQEACRTGALEQDGQHPTIRRHRIKKH